MHIYVNKKNLEKRSKHFNFGGEFPENMENIKIKLYLRILPESNSPGDGNMLINFVSPKTEFELGKGHWGNLFDNAITEIFYLRLF